MSTAHISIIMATRNVAATLPSALESLSAYAPESPLLIWDGQSSDGTQDLIHQHAGQVTRWESGQDSGIYNAFHRALTWAKTPFVYFLGADDCLRKEWTETAIRVKNESTLYYGDVWLTKAQRRYNGSFNGLDLARTNISQQAVFYPRILFKQHPFRDNYHLQADWEFHMWCHHQPEISFQYCDACICDFNDHSGASSTGYDQAFNRDYPMLLKKYFGISAYLRYGLIAGLAHHTRKLRGKS